MTIASLLPRASACGLRPPITLDLSQNRAKEWFIGGKYISHEIAEAILRDWAVGVMAEAGWFVAVFNGRWLTRTANQGTSKTFEYLDAHDYPSAVASAFARFVEGRERSKP